MQIPDILPTVWDIATGGAPFPKDIDGKSFAPVIKKGKGSRREFAYFENGYTRSVFKDGLHYIAWRYPESLIESMKSGELEEAPDHLGTFDNSHSSVAMEQLEHYWDPDQLYDLSADPHEIHNVYSDPSYADQVRELRDELRNILETFRHPFDLDGGGFQRSDAFAKLKQPRIDRGTSYIYWYEPGMYNWPPEDDETSD